MSTPVARSYSAPQSRRRDRRIQLVSFVGPAAVGFGVIWAILQPYRLTLLHPRGESFWWLAVEPPLLVVAVGLVFAIVVARPVIADLESHDAAKG